VDPGVPRRIATARGRRHEAEGRERDDVRIACPASNDPIRILRLRPDADAKRSAATERYPPRLEPPCVCPRSASRCVWHSFCTRHGSSHWVAPAGPCARSLIVSTSWSLACHHRLLCKSACRSATVRHRPSPRLDRLLQSILHLDGFSCLSIQYLHVGDCPVSVVLINPDVQVSRAST